MFSYGFSFVIALKLPQNEFDPFLTMKMLLSVSKIQFFMLIKLVFGRATLRALFRTATHSFPPIFSVAHTNSD